MTENTPWDLASLQAEASKLIRQTLRDTLPLLPALILPGLLAALLTAFRLGDPRTAGVASLVCHLTLCFELAGLYARFAQTAGQTLARIGALCETLYPVLATALPLLGRPGSAALFSPLAALTGGFVAGTLAEWTLFCTGAAAAVALAGSLPEHISLSKLSGLLKTVPAFCLTGLLTVFTGLFTLQGTLSKGFDGVSTDAAKLAIGNLLPVVGGEVADSLGAMLGSAALVKNALGITGLLLLGALLLRPMLQLAAAVLLLKAAAALCEPLGATRQAQVLGDMSGVFGLLLAAVASAALLLVLLIGAFLALFGG